MDSITFLTPHSLLTVKEQRACPIQEIVEMNAEINHVNSYLDPNPKLDSTAYGRLVWIDSDD